MFTSKKILLSSLLALATAFSFAAPIPESAKTNGFAVGPQAWSFNRFSAVEAVEKAAAAGATVIEFYPGQRFSPEGKERFDHNSSPEQIKKIKELLKKHKIHAANYGVVNIPNNEQEARKIFAFAKELGLYSITTESTDAIEVVDKLVKEYDIRVGYHNHPRNKNNPNYKVWNPEYIRDLVKDRDPRVGAAIDTGHWATDGIKALDGMRVLEGRIVSLHLKDRPVLGRGTADVPYGTGVIGIAAVLDELKRQGFQGNISIEYETNWDKNVPQIAQCIGFVRGYGAQAK